MALGGLGAGVRRASLSDKLVRRLQAADELDAFRSPPTLTWLESEPPRSRP